jgi:hypothetical protein
MRQHAPTETQQKKAKKRAEWAIGDLFDIPWANHEQCSGKAVRNLSQADHWEFA